MRRNNIIEEAKLPQKGYTPIAERATFDNDPEELIRFYYLTKDGKFPNRPLIASEEVMIELITLAFRTGIFSHDSCIKLLKVLQRRVNLPKDFKDLHGYYADKKAPTEKDMEEVKKEWDNHYQ